MMGEFAHARPAWTRSAGPQALLYWTRVRPLER